MEYPSDFPPDLQPAVDVALHEAELEFLDAKAESKDFYSEAKKLIGLYAIKVFRAFAYQACLAQERGIWTGERTRKRIEQMLHNIIRGSYVEKYPSRIEQYDLDKFERLITRSLKETEVWRQIQEELARVAKFRADEAANIRLFPKPAPLTITGGTPLVTLTEDGAGAAKKPEPKVRTTREPNPDLLTKSDTVNRKNAARAVGISERTLDRWISDGKVTPIGAGVRKRFKSKDLQKLLAQKQLDISDTK